MIEIQNFEVLDKGSLYAVCDVSIIPWKLTLNEIKVFKSGANRWITMPAREFINDAGEKKYIELITFNTNQVKNRFRDQIMEHIDKFLEQNPDPKPQDVIQEDSELPF